MSAGPTNPHVSRCAKLLPIVLSVIAGSADVLAFSDSACSSPMLPAIWSSSPHTWWPGKAVIIGFTGGTGLGAMCFAVAGLKSLGLPAGLALLALVLSLKS
ncbi:MAG: hypothetical protein JWL69_2312 [Phycisphaerales bacterium]|nr:hypothetical protein [Phycisphaerales bacterium]MDB5353939.1 hypothetical protein [Phycisphaerales bacterium]